ncbi:MAG: GAF domain-containing protein [Chloroflexi bacterium]|nr:GAF domain-containing protein [Chloroflexota bacterium]
MEETDPKQVEEDLRLRSKLLDAATDVILVHDAEGKLLFANESAYKTRGYTREEFMALNLRDLVAPEHARFIAPRMKELMERGEISFEAAHRCRDGTIVPVEVKARKIQWGSIPAIMSIGRDITERKRAEQALVASEQRFREFVDFLPQIAFEVDVEGNLTFVNQAAFRATGYTPDDLAEGLKARQMVVPQDRARVQENIRRVLRGERSPGHEYTARRKDGSTFPILIYSAPLMKEGKVVGLRGIVVDITERKRAQEETDRRNRELAALNTVMAAVAGALELKEVLNTALEKIAEVTGADAGWIRLLNEEGDALVLAAQYGAPVSFLAAMGRSRPTAGGLAGGARKTGRLVMVEDIERDNILRWRKQKLAQGWRSQVTAPLKSPKGFLGVLTLVSRERAKFGSGIESLLTLAANEIALGVEKATLFREIEHRNRELAALNSVMLAVGSTLELEEALTVALERAAGALGGEGGWVRLLNERRDALSLAASWGISPELAADMRSVPLHGSAAGEAYKRDRCMIVSDLADSTVLFSGKRIMADGWQSVAVAPLRRKGRVLGVMTLLGRRKDSFEASDVRLLEMMASQVGLAVENARLFRAVERWNRELGALNDIVVAASGARDLEEVLGAALEKTADVIGAGGGWIRLVSVSGDTSQLSAWRGIGDPLLRALKNVATERLAFRPVVETGRPLLIGEVEEERDLLLGKEIAEDGWRSLMTVALRGKERNVGLLALVASEANKFGPHSLLILEMLAGQIGLVVEKAHLFDEVQKGRGELAALNTVMAAISRSVGLGEVQRIALEQAAAAVGAEGGWLRLVNETQDDFDLSDWWGISEALAQALKMRAGLTGVGTVLKAGKPVVFGDITQDRSLRLWKEMAADGWRSNMVVPLWGREGIVGSLVMVSRDVNKFADREVRLLETMAGHVGLSVEKARLLGEVERRNRELAALNTVTTAASSSLESGEVLGMALEKTMGALGVEGGWARLLSQAGDQLVIAARRGISPSLIDRMPPSPADAGVSGRAMKAGRPVVVNDIETDTLLLYGGALRTEGWQSLVAVPLMSSKSGLLGTFNLVSRRKGEFGAEAVRLLELVANQIGVAVDNARLFEEVQRHDREMAALNAVTAAVSSSLELNEVLEVALEKTAAVLGAGGGWVRLLNEARDRVVMASHRGLSAELADLAATSPLEDRVSARVIEEPLVIPDIEASVLPLKDPLVADGWRSMIRAPLKSPNSFLGVITLFSREEGRFGPDAESLLATVANQIGLAVEKGRLYEEMRNRALTNWLTGLYNRGHFEERLREEMDRSMRSQQPLSVVIMDVDDMKRVNDTYGHMLGDKTLQAVAKGIREGVRVFDVAARYGGDEFSLILPGADALQAQSVVQRVQARVRAAVAGVIPDGGMGFSAGIACYHPGAGPVARDDLLRIADDALYRAKRQGRGVVCVGSVESK